MLAVSPVRPRGAKLGGLDFGGLKPAFSRSTRLTIWLSIAWADCLSMDSGTRFSRWWTSLYCPYHFFDLPLIFWPVAGSVIRIGFRYKLAMLFLRDVL